MRAFVALASLGVLASCTAVAQPDTASAPSGTVGGVGALPDPVAIGAVPDSPVTVGSASASDPSTATDPSSSVGSTDPAGSTNSKDSTGSSDATTASVEAVTTTTVPSLFPIGAHALGNRVLMIGDSVTASIAQRYGGQACDALVPLGWRLEVDAEVGRFIDFGKQVLDKRLDAGWDAAIIFLGNNYGKNQEVYAEYLHNIILRLVPRPVVLINTSLFDPAQQQVNDAIALQALTFTNVAVIDWATVTQDPTLTGGDGLHLTEAGRRALAYQLAIAMGTAPAQPGECLKTNYKNDSAGSPNGPAGNENKPKATTTTVKKPTPTTAKTTTSSSTVTNTTQSPSGTTSPPSTQTPTVTTQPVVTTAAPTTAAPTTAAPTTAAPTTAAPTTAAPTTAAPTTAAPPTTPAPGP